MTMPTYNIEFGRVIYATKDLGAILMDDELWHPFRYFDDGEWDISDEAYIKPSTAYMIATKLYT